ncbi:MAG: hypothetical protein NXI10_01015 [bacterium]|nr:hypothetical protein [bacterium]
MDKAKNIKRLLFGGILLAISAPVLLTLFPVIDFHPLEGSFEEKEKPELNFNDLYSGKYQKKMEEYLNDNTGGRPYMVRINNQWDFWLFNKANANAVVIGKDNYLYEKSYIDAYYGDDFIGDDLVREKMQKLAQVRDTLNRRGVEVLVVFAPGKASFFPEYFPDYLKRSKKRSNYDAYREAFEQCEVPFIDFRDWFEEKKGTLEYPLFPKGGVHWSSYGEVLAADSLLRFMNELTTESQLNTIQIQGIKRKNRAYDRDEDIEESMNLLFNIDDGELGYPQYVPVKHSAERTTRVLTIADSYFWGIYNWGRKSYLNDGPFWYYNREMYPETYTKQTFVQDLVDLSYEVEKNDLVLIMFTDANLKDFAYDFIDRLHDEYCSNGREEREKRIAQIIEAIYNTPQWLESIKKQAKQEGIPLEDALRKNAVYTMIQEKKR